MSPRVIDEATLRAREQVVLEAALEFIAQEGVAALTMDKLVARVPYSKGTVYNHFTGKEDLLTALCNTSMQTMLPLFQRILAFEGRSRDKILAIGFAYMLFALLHPEKFMLVITAKTSAVSEKASQKRQDEHLDLESRLIGVAVEIIEEALEQGELVLPPGRQPEQVAFSLWAMCFGTIVLLLEGVERCPARQDLLLEQEVINHSNIVLDGLGWQPLSGDVDLHAVVARFKEKLFATEVAQLAEHGKVLSV